MTMKMNVHGFVPLPTFKMIYEFFFFFKMIHERQQKEVSTRVFKRLQKIFLLSQSEFSSSAQLSQSILVSHNLVGSIQTDPLLQQSNLLLGHFSVLAENKERYFLIFFSIVKRDAYIYIFLGILLFSSRGEFSFS